MNASTKHLTTTGLFPCKESDIRHVLSLSGGAGSYGAGKRLAEQVTASQITLLFCDTIIEDQDTYRFLLEGAADIIGVACPHHLLKRALSLPELSIDDPHCLERKQRLDFIRYQAMDFIPGLVWIADGRHPFEVFEDESFIGNSQHDPCSLLLKRKLINDWRDANCRPDATVCYVGIDNSERHRLTAMLPRVAPWLYEAPLCDTPYLSKAAIVSQMIDNGINPPRAYELGFPHNNCGGLCCKGGHSQFALYLKRWPVRYAFSEWWENRVIKKVGNYSMMSDRRGGDGKKPLTMAALRLRIEAGEKIGNDSWGGCGCALPAMENVTR